MKIGLISDLHIDYNKIVEGYQDFLIKELKKKNFQLLIVAGDISSDFDTTVCFLNILKENLPVPVFYVAGNHDFWHAQNVSLWGKLKFFEECAAPLIFKDIGICGNTGWYDGTYTYLSGREYILKGKTFSHYWTDHRFIKEAKENTNFHKELCEKFLSDLERDINILKERGAKSIVVVNHMVPHKDLLSPLPEHSHTNGFFGTVETFKLIQNYPSIKNVIYGHTHYLNDSYIDGVRLICSPMGYRFEWNGKMKHRFNEVFKIIEI